MDKNPTGIAWQRTRQVVGGYEVNELYRSHEESLRDGGDLNRSEVHRFTPRSRHSRKLESCGRKGRQDGHNALWKSRKEHG